jgi:hypothetical protein
MAKAPEDATDPPSTQKVADRLHSLHASSELVRASAFRALAGLNTNDALVVGKGERGAVTIEVDAPPGSLPPGNKVALNASWRRPWHVHYGKEC